MRAIEDGRAGLPGKPAPNWKRRGIMAGVLVVSVALVWWALVAWSAERTPGEQLSGLDPRSAQQQLMAQARQAQFQSPGEASELYAQVLQSEPENVEALTYHGWTLALDAVQRGGDSQSVDDSGTGGADQAVVDQLRRAVGSLIEATKVDPTYPDPKCFLGIVNYRFLGLADIALPWIDECLAGNPPADIRSLVQPLRDEIAGVLAESTPSTAPASTTP